MGKRNLTVVLTFFVLLFIGIIIFLGMSSKHIEVYPPDFLFGTATAAYQVEGGNVNSDWAEFEKQKGAIKTGERSGRASDSWNMVSQDIGLMKSLGVNSYRFSVEWSKLEPEQGKFDEEAFDHYTVQIKELRQAGITPLVTLLHFTFPKWVSDKGGLLSEDFPELFEIFTKKVVSELGSDVDLWCTINEPNVMIANGYIYGIWPPEKKSQSDMVRAYRALLLAHAKSSRVIRTKDKNAKIGVAMNVVDFQAKSWLNPLDMIASKMVADAYDWSFYDSIKDGRIKFWAIGFHSIDEALPELKNSVDFFGMNYYQRKLVSFSPFKADFFELSEGSGDKSDLGWEIYPQGLLAMLRQSYGRYHLPIYVTENGVADKSGHKQQEFLREHLNMIDNALQEGIPVKGYYYWSLLDNFEWDLGFGPKFGLYAVDNDSFKRSAKPGANVYAELINERKNGRLQ